MESFINYLQSHNLSAHSIDSLVSSANPEAFKKGEFVLRQGEVCRHKVFVEKGLLRTFGLTTDGNEHILQFSPENTWTLDVESYDRQIPALYNISAIEKTDVLIWERNDFERLRSELPELQSLSQQLISRNIYNSRHRLLTALGETPEQKYENFVHTSGDLLSRLPLRMIASFLGISLKTLTRIRKAQLHRQSK
ncbi:Crp/Fnr family transcriptional regulator [Flavobacterium sp. MAH-1]|uniref:Crp/Fnr family transcriptional regulator n=1 Tax=Flavobacterium agri TaxID=2743471 RepID=A0A7Y8Y3P8_9FLAO|nr:Crp/Fnr family transcriptional regulator [Flavobacterium agri]NUY81731.1 Crp/Fnr family transcriptional regulator [Flavobacterium agri]NYA71755.1 Crp/Fnr family transcriptional regulator [Flavobacterium agri]